VPVGTAARVRETIEALTDWPVKVCTNPEFLKEGAAVEDFMKPDRVVIGVEDEQAEAVLRDLYAPFVRQGNQMLMMDVASAELTKYAANAMLANRISFMNMIARICERVGADVDKVRLGVGSDRRIGTSFLFPGVGYGGSCFPKDVKALIRVAHKLGEDTSLLDAVEQINEGQKSLLLERVLRRFGEDLSARRFAIWGLSFKPQTDDMREAPSLITIEGLLERGAQVFAHDPEAMQEARHYFGERVTYCTTPYDALEGADALIIHTEWHPYRHPDFTRMRALMREPVVMDGRNLFRPERLSSLGFEYHSIGRPVGTPSRATTPA
jgi:UDPglucose 6-dehydrogenase